MTDSNSCTGEELGKQKLSNVNSININCKYEKLGCEFKAPLNKLEELKTHYREEMYRHLKMCYREYAMLEEKFEQLRAIMNSSSKGHNQELNC